MLYVGRLAKEKRVKDLWDILLELQVEHPNCRLCFVGTGPQHEELETKMFGQDHPSVVFLGELHGLELAQAFASADVFVFPSDSETLGFVVLEAMASGLAVVAARAGGVPSLIDDNRTGYLCAPGNTREYVQRLSQLQEDSSLRFHMGEQAREETEQWSWDASMYNLRHVHYRQAMENFELRWGRRIKRFLQAKSISGQNTNH
jgi:sulfoquinovosyltransferase